MEGTSACPAGGGPGDAAGVTVTEPGGCWGCRTPDHARDGLRREGGSAEIALHGDAAANPVLSPSKFCHRALLLSTHL